MSADRYLYELGCTARLIWGQPDTVPMLDALKAYATSEVTVTLFGGDQEKMTLEQVHEIVCWLKDEKCLGQRLGEYVAGVTIIKIAVSQEVFKLNRPD